MSMHGENVGKRARDRKRATERDQAGELRDESADQRDQAAGQRDQSDDRRDQVAEQRDDEADRRDRASEQRDAAARQRDLAADDRDQAAEKRDRVADARDDLANDRDRADGKRWPSAKPASGVGGAPRPLTPSALARQDAASDRRSASQDRTAGASDRDHSESGRDTASTDRVSGASDRTEAGLDRDHSHSGRGSGVRERGQAESDRRTASADRDASAQDRDGASLDGLTGVYLRDIGFLELEREIDRARRTLQPLVLAFVDVDHLKALNDAHGHAAGDQMLIRVATTLRAELRAYDVIMRYGGDEFVCGLPGMGLADARRRFALVNAAISAPPVPGSVSVGVAQFQPEDSLADLVARADADLYRERRLAGHMQHD